MATTGIYPFQKDKIRGARCSRSSANGQGPPTHVPYRLCPRCQVAPFPQVVSCIRQCTITVSKARLKIGSKDIDLMMYTRLLPESARARSFKDATLWVSGRNRNERLTLPRMWDMYMIVVKNRLRGFTTQQRDIVAR